MTQSTRPEIIETDGRRIIEVARAAPDKRVPQYPTWTLADLLRHVARIHARTTEICRTLPQERIALPELTPGEDLISQAEIALAQLLDALDEADPDASVWTFGQDKRLRFWERRMVIETGVHRWDAQSAQETADALPPLVASDGLDEFSDFYLARLGHVPSIEMVATDLDRSWRYGEGESVASVYGTASDLFLRLMSRPGVSLPPEWESAVDALESPAG